MLNLRCACCGGSAPAEKQWYNRDTGFGCCAKCFMWSVEREGMNQSINYYGKPGVHVMLPDPWENKE